MNDLIPLEDKKAYSEILYLLGTMDEDYLTKVPKELIDFFEKAKLENYNVNIDENISYMDNFEKYTIDLFNVMNLNFWCDNEIQRRDAITYLLDKPVEFKLNDQIGKIEGKSGNYFQEILEKNKERENIIENFKQDMTKNKKEKAEEVKKEEVNKKETIFLKLKKLFKK